ncbi:pseudouridine synthase [Candidatus Phytoplasma prunorum]|uniref:pseudouridine synthase n=1 Tax=Candidatus Phytoplasma prunorum TaxID=47565 RepID=UPI002FF3AE90
MERLHKILSYSNVASRRKSETLILEKKVKVNGKLVTKLGTKVSKKDIILVDDKIIKNSDNCYYLMNKPSGFISTVKDEKNRPTVIDLINDTEKNRIYPIGRLDFNTTGLLLITNDGQLTQKLTHPSSLIEKEYHVKINYCLSSLELKRIQKGVVIDKNYLSIPKKIKILKKRFLPKPSTWLQIIITEGKNHQIRKMIEKLGFRILKLVRYRYAFLTIEGIKKGQYRTLKIHEIKKLKILKYF